MLDDKEEAIMIMLQKVLDFYNKLEPWDGGSGRDPDEFRCYVHRLQDMIAARPIYKLNERVRKK